VVVEISYSLIAGAAHTVNLASSRLLRHSARAGSDKERYMSWKSILAAGVLVLSVPLPI
jgi:hypothetical protein